MQNVFSQKAGIGGRGFEGEWRQPSPWTEEARGPKASEGWLGRADEVAPEGAGRKKMPHRPGSAILISTKKQRKEKKSDGTE